jgi:hypothetical protein
MVHVREPFASRIGGVRVDAAAGPSNERMPARQKRQTVRGIEATGDLATDDGEEEEEQTGEQVEQDSHSETDENSETDDTSESETDHEPETDEDTESKSEHGQESEEGLEEDIQKLVDAVRSHLGQTRAKMAKAVREGVQTLERALLEKGSGKTAEDYFTPIEWKNIQRKLDSASAARAEREAKKLCELYGLTFDNFTTVFGQANARKKRFTRELYRFRAVGATWEQITSYSAPFSAQRRAPDRGNRGRSKQDMWTTADLEKGLAAFIEVSFVTSLPISRADTDIIMYSGIIQSCGQHR